MKTLDHTASPVTVVRGAQMVPRAGTTARPPIALGAESSPAPSAADTQPGYCVHHWLDPAPAAPPDPFQV